MKTKLLTLLGCLATVGVVNAQSVSIDCKQQTNYNLNYNLCNVNTVKDTGAATKVKNPSVQTSSEKINTPVQNVGTGQVSGATVQGGAVDATVQAQQKQTALIEMVSKAPTPEVTKVAEFTFGEIERKIFSCQEMSPIRHWAKNPNNTPGKKILGQTGVVLGIVDSYGWYETPFTFTDTNGKEVVAFGGANAWKNAVYKNGVFHNWVGFPPDDGKNNLSPGWGWNFSQIGFCENRV